MVLLVMNTSKFLPLTYRLWRKNQAIKNKRIPLPKKSKQEHVSTKVGSSRIQSSMSNFIVKTNSREKDALDEAIAKFFYSCNIPFLVSENLSFINMINLLRPGYEPPKRKQLAGDLLDKIQVSCN